MSETYHGHRKRLRQRFIRTGTEGFHDYEILELLLTYAIPQRDVKPLAKRLIARFKGLRGVFDATVEELCSINGMGEYSALLITLIKEICKIYLQEQLLGKDIIRSPKDVVDFLNIALSGERVEKFLAIYLNSKNEVLGIETLHEGTIDQTVVYPRKVIEKAFQHNARSVIFVHNHPSGDPTPSTRDMELTRNLEAAASAVDIIVHDHIIIGKNSHFSARENGWISGRKRR